MGTALEDTGARFCCQADWDPGWKQVLGSATPQAVRNNSICCLGVAQLGETSVFRPLLKQPDSWLYRQKGGLSEYLSDTQESGMDRESGFYYQIPISSL